VKRNYVGVLAVSLAVTLMAGACSSRSSSAKAPSTGPTKTGPIARLLNAQTGRPMFSGPNGEIGYGGPQAGAQSWTMPDGTKAWYAAGTSVDEGNIEALRNADLAGKAEAPGDFGSLKAVCGPGKATGATAQGVTDTSIDVGTMSDPGSSVMPGLNQELFDSATAFAKWCNDAGGIAGRKINVHLRDSKLFGVAARTIDACAQDFSLVGGGPVFDDAGTDIRVKCGLIDIPAYTVSVKAAEAPLKVEATPLPTEEVQVSMFRGVQHMFPTATRVGYLAGNLPGIVTNSERAQEAATTLGLKTVFNEYYPAGGLDNPASYVERMKAANIDVLFAITDANTLSLLEKAMQTANWYPKAIVELDNLYSTALITDGGAALQNTWVSVHYFPFELVSQNAPTKQYLDIMAADDPSAKPSALGLQGWDAWLLFATAARDCGSDLTRACVLAKASSHSDWTGGGLKAVGTTSTTNRQMTQCYMMLKATSAGFAPDPAFLPATSGAFNCDPANVVQLKTDYTK
jgi:ABC-type branched-subunit amino acid transport system substrate-binding protein